jgi:hypothetical protein
MPPILEQDTLRLPRTAREMAFVAALEWILKQDGPAPWPVLVLSAPDRRQHAPDVPTLATTRRIMLRDEISSRNTSGLPGAAAAR